jgi:glyoxylase-like metal-dependent hydrolase (beta-lactamase superfamily II)
MLFRLSSAKFCALLLLLFPFVISAQQAPEGVLLKPVQIAPHTYFVQGLPEIGSSNNQNFISNSGFVITPNGVVVIDALGSPVLARKLIAEIHKITDKKIVAVVLTHYHADHIYGLQEFKKVGAKIYAQYLAKNYLTSDTAQQRLIASRTNFAPWINNQTHLVKADVWINRNYQFKVGGIEFLITHVGPAHTPEDLMVYVPSENVLFAGDLVFRGRIPFVGNADSRGWLNALNTIQNIDPNIIIPGHGAYSIDPQHDIEFTRSYLSFLRESMAPAAQNLDSFDDAYSRVNWSEYEGMPLFRAANRINAYNVYLSIQEE